jgi:hypothetical protein
MLLIDVEYQPMIRDEHRDAPSMQIELSTRRFIHALTQENVTTLYASKHFVHDRQLRTILDEHATTMTLILGRRPPRLVELTNQKLARLFATEWSEFSGADHLLIACFQCGSAHKLPDLTLGTCSQRCLWQLMECEVEAVQRAERRRAEGPKKPGNPSWARSGISIHTVPGPGPTQ